MRTRILALATVLVGSSASAAFAGVSPPVVVSEPMSLAILGAGVGALYLIKKLRG
jgi:hypothetical protein